MRQSAYLDRRAGRQVLTEYLSTHFGMLEEFIDIGDIGRRLDQVLRGRRPAAASAVRKFSPTWLICAGHIARAHDLRRPCRGIVVRR